MGSHDGNLASRHKLLLILPFSLLLGLWLPGSLRSQIQTPLDKDQGAISREVDLVVLPVSVTDHKGRTVGGLTADDFQVFDDGQRQKIAQFSHDDVPLTVGLVVDDSDSMLPNRPEVVTASSDFLRSSNPGDQVFVVNFNEVASLGLPPGIPFTSDVQSLENAVLHGPTRGRTALYDAAYLGLEHLESGTQNKKALVIISDGGDNASHHDFQQILNLAQHDNVLIYTVGIVSEDESDVNPRRLRKLARDTGGQAFFPTAASDVPGICQEIARDLREQYTLAYVPSSGLEGGKYHAVRVTVRAPGRGKLIARTRAGYYDPVEATSSQK